MSLHSFLKEACLLVTPIKELGHLSTVIFLEAMKFLHWFPPPLAEHVLRTAKLVRTQAAHGAVINFIWRVYIFNGIRGLIGDFLLSITEKLSYSPLIPHLTILLFISEQLLSESKSMTKRNLWSSSQLRRNLMESIHSVQETEMWTVWRQDWLHRN